MTSGVWPCSRRVKEGLVLKTSCEAKTTLLWNCFRTWSSRVVSSAVVSAATLHKATDGSCGAGSS